MGQQANRAPDFMQHKFSYFKVRVVHLPSTEIYYSCVHTLPSISNLFSPELTLCGLEGEVPGVYTAVLQHRYGQFYTRTVLLGGRHDGLGGGRRGATQGLYKTDNPGQPVQAALKQA